MTDISTRMKAIIFTAIATAIGSAVSGANVELLAIIKKVMGL